MAKTITLAEALGTVNKYELKNKKEAEAYLAVHFRLEQEMSYKPESYEDMAEYHESELIKMRSVLNSFPKEAPAYKVVQDLVDSHENLLNKVRKCLALI